MKNMLIRAILMAGTVACVAMLSGCGTSGAGNGNVVVQAPQVVVPAEPEVKQEVTPSVGIETPPTVVVEEPTAPEEVVVVPEEVIPEPEAPVVEESEPVEPEAPVVEEEVMTEEDLEEIVKTNPSNDPLGLLGGGGGLTIEDIDSIYEEAGFGTQYNPSNDGEYVFGQSGATSDVPMANIQ